MISDSEPHVSLRTEGRREGKTRENREKTRKRSQKEGGGGREGETRGERKETSKNTLQNQYFCTFFRGRVVSFGSGRESDMQGGKGTREEEV